MYKINFFFFVLYKLLHAKGYTRLTQPSFTTLEIQSMKITHTIQYWLLKASQTLWYICLISTQTPTERDIKP